MEKQEIIIEIAKEYSDDIFMAVAKLVRQLGENFIPVTEDHVREILAAEDTTLLLARTADTHEIVGMVTLIVYRIPYYKKGWIEDFVVDSSQRGLGIGEKLLTQAIDIAQSKHVRSLNLTSNPKREGPNALYRKFGFEQRETNVYRMLFEGE